LVRLGSVDRQNLNLQHVCDTSTERQLKRKEISHQQENETETASLNMSEACFNRYVFEGAIGILVLGPAGEGLVFREKQCGRESCQM
jgi:hypothetical protein